MSADEALARVRSVVSSSGFKKFAGSVLAFGGSLVFLFLLALWVGPLAAVLYLFLFLFMLTLFPVSIGLFGSAVPNAIGKLHIILGAVAFNHHYLVQRKHGWEWRPGAHGRVYIDGRWHDIDGGRENYSVLGWRPFGILRYKDSQTWKQQRADEKANRLRGAAETDGGAKTVERGGFTEVDGPIETGIDGTWILDLKRIYTRGIRKIGDIELIETAEEIIERGQVNDGKMSQFGPMVETFVFMFLGVLTGLVYLLLVG